MPTQQEALDAFARVIAEGVIEARRERPVEIPTVDAKRAA